MFGCRFHSAVSQAANPHSSSDTATGLNSDWVHALSGRGVCQHVDLGARGGGHHDCGPGFPMDRVLDMARGGIPTPTPPEDTMAITGFLMEDGRAALFVHLESGEVKQIEQDRPNADWWKKPDGTLERDFTIASASPAGDVIGPHS